MTIDTKANIARRNITILQRLLASGFSLLALSSIETASAQTCIGEQTYLKRTIAAVKKSLEEAQGFDLAARAVPVTEEGADSIPLKGYLLQGTTGEGFILVAQGNGMSAREVAARFAKLRPPRRSILVFDYRGHGENANTPASLEGMLADYRKLWAVLTKRYSRRRGVLYGFSQGGVVAASMIDQVAIDRGILILDAIPTRLPRYQLFGWKLFSCPKEFDPIERVLAAPDLPRLALVRGEEDKQVTWRDSKEVFEAARRRGAVVLSWPGLYHPLSPRDNDSVRINNVEEIIGEFER